MMVLFGSDVIEFYSGLRFFDIVEIYICFIVSSNFVMGFCSGFVGGYSWLVGLYVVVW